MEEVKKNLIFESKFGEVNKIIEYDYMQIR